jgi:putative peptidoglycan lipid II flippase
LAFFTFGSQLFALVRDRLLAYSFGVGEILDMFYAAFRIPDTMYALLASTVSLFVLIPFMERAERKGEGYLRDFLSNMFSFFSIALIVLAGIAYIFTPQIVAFLYKGFSVSMQEGSVTMIRILLLQPLFLGVSNLFAAYIQIRGRFLLYAIAPIFYNVGIIIGILYIYPFLGNAGLAWGVVLGAILHLGIQTPFMLQNKMLPRLKAPDWKKVLEVIRISIPRTVTLSTQQIVFLVMISLASLYAVGSVSSFSFAWNLQTVPLAIIGVSYSVAAFPKLVHFFEKNERKEFKNLIIVATKQIIFWAIPTTVLFIVLRAQIVRLVLGSGEFNWDGTKMTSAVLALFVVSLVAQGIIVLLVRACYAEGKTAVPLVVNVTSGIFTITMACIFLYLAKIDFINISLLAELMRVEGVFSSEVLLIAMAYSIGAIVNMVLLLGYYERRYAPFLRELFGTTWHSFIASILAGYGAYLALNLVTNIVSIDTVVGLFVQAVVAGVVGACVWSVVLVVLGNKDIISAWGALQVRFTKSRVRRARGSIEGN